MPSTTVKRSQFKTFMNVAPSTTASYKLIGDGVTSGEISYNPEVTEEKYIHLDSASKSVEGYAPAMPVDMVCKAGDDVFDFVDGLRQARAVLTAAETDIVNVWLYETPTSGEYPAEKQSVAISFDKFGGDGVASNKLGFTLNYIGDPVLGTFNPTTKAFTPNP
jgi:hypothetical protein